MLGMLVHGPRSIAILTLIVATLGACAGGQVVTIDGGSSDAEVLGESSVDGGRVDAWPDVSSANFCSTDAAAGAILCDDFETGTVAPQWSFAQKSSTIDVEAGVGLGGSKYGLRMRHETRTSGGDGAVALTYTALTPATGVEVSLRVRFDLAQPDQEIAILWTNGTHSPVCYFFAGGASCYAASTKLAAVSFPAVAAGEEHRWALRAGPSGLQVLVDGKSVGSDPRTIGFGAKFDALVGPEHVFQSDAWNAVSDDVVIRPR